MGIVGPKPKSWGENAYRTSRVRAFKAWRAIPDCTRIARTSSPKCSWASRMICWVISSVKVYAVSLWIGIFAMAMLLSHQGMGQWRGVVSVQRRTYGGSLYGHARACAQGARGKQSLRQAEERIQSQRLIIDYQTAVFHSLNFVRE